jgi:hypothetical protein
MAWLGFNIARLVERFWKSIVKKKVTIQQLRIDQASEFENILKAIDEYTKDERFSRGARNDQKLRRSLANRNLIKLANRTLLNPEVHKAHSQRLGDRYVNKWNRWKTSLLKDKKNLPAQFRDRKKIPTDRELASSYIKFFTLIDSVTEVDHKSALKAAQRMKRNLQKVLSENQKIWCVGAIESEIISLKVMRCNDPDQSDSSAQRKLNVCETLAEDLKGTFYQNDTSLFLIHFHGIVMAKSKHAPAHVFDEFEKSLKSKKYKQWNKSDRQIQLKPLSESWATKTKTTESNLKHIANYITKGANDLKNGVVYLKYKTVFDNSDYQSEEEWTSKHAELNKKLGLLSRADESEEAEEVKDWLSLTQNEIAEMALFLNELMSWNSTRSGYLVSTGS